MDSPAAAFVIENLVVSVDSPSAAEQEEVKCVLCGEFFKLTETPVVRRHYEEIHGYVFEGATKRKRIPSSASPNPEKRRSPEPDGFPNPFQSKRHLLDYAVFHQAAANLPFSYWDCPTTKIVMDLFSECLGQKISGRIVRGHLPQVAEQIRGTIGRKLHARLFSLTINSGTRRGRPFLAVAAQYMDDFRNRALHLGLLATDKETTAGDIQERIVGLLEAFGLSVKQIYCVSVDSGSKAAGCSRELLEEVRLKLSQLMDKKEPTAETREDLGHETELTRTVEGEEIQTATMVPPHCAAYTVQCALYDAITQYKTEFEGIKEAAIEIRRKISRSDLPQQIPARGSHYDIVKGLLKVEEHFKEQMTAAQWTFAKELAAALERFEVLTPQKQKEQYIFGDLVRDTFGCEMALEDMTHPSEFSAVLLGCLRKRRESIMAVDNLPLQAALFLDPRFNFLGSCFMSEEQQQRIIPHLEDLYLRIKSIKPKEAVQDPQEAPKTRTFQDVIRRLMKERSNPEEKIRRELERFAKEDWKENLRDTIGFWRQRALASPELGELASVVLSVPCTQGSLGSLPFTLGDLGSEDFLFIRLNKDLVPGMKELINKPF